MAVQTTEEFLTAGSTTYPTVIEKLKDTDLKVRIGGALQNYVTSSPGTGQYTVTNNPTTIVLGAAASGEVHIYRETDVETPAAVFTAGSSIRASDLNAIHDMARFAAVEHRNDIITADIRDGQITSAKIKDDTIVDADINVGANIQGSKLANDSVSLDKLGSGTLPSDIQVDSNNIGSGGFDDRYYTETELDNGQLNNQYYTETELNPSASAGANVLDARYYTETELDSGQLNNQYYTETELNPSASAGQNVLDARYYTKTELNGGALNTNYLTTASADARYFNISSGDTIKDGDVFPDNDTTIATTAAINDRIIDLIDDVGGFVPIANETSFPTANPDVNNGTGTIVSVKAASTTLTPSGTTVTITNGAGTGNTVTITGVTDPIPQTLGFLVETTTTLHTYTFHRLVPKATEVTTVASNIGNVNNVGNNIADITNVSGSIASINSVATDITNVNNVGNSITNVNTVASNLGTVNDFAARYSSGASNPTTNLDTGDLFFNTTANELRVYNGTSWQGGVTAQGSLYTDNSVDLHLNQNNPTTGHVLSWNGSDYAWVAPSGNTTYTAGSGLTLTGTTFSVNTLNQDTTGTSGGFTAGDASNLNAGTIPDARFPATLPVLSGANLTNLTAANLTGALPAISGAALTNLPAQTDATKLPLTGGTLTGSVTFEDAINENVHTLTGTPVTLEPDNGMIQTYTLSGTSTANDHLSDGQSMLLIVTAGGNSLTIAPATNNPAVKWVGGAPPTLGTVTGIELFKIGTQLYAATVGDFS